MATERKNGRTYSECAFLNFYLIRSKNYLLPFLILVIRYHLSSVLSLHLIHLPQPDRKEQHSLLQR